MTSPRVLRPARLHPSRLRSAALALTVGVVVAGSAAPATAASPSGGESSSTSEPAPTPTGGSDDEPETDADEPEPTGGPDDEEPTDEAGERDDEASEEEPVEEDGEDAPEDQPSDEATATQAPAEDSDEEPAATATASTPQRVEGGDRVETSLAVAQDRFPDGEGAVVLASAERFADALAGGALADHVDGPLLLTDRSELDPRVASELEERLAPGSTVWLLGGRKALDEDVESAVTDLGFEIRRIEGDNRYDTAAAIVREVLGDDPERCDLVVATGTDFADGASASGSTSQSRPLLFTRGTKVPASTAEVLADCAEGSGELSVTAVGGAAAAALEEGRPGVPEDLTVTEVVGEDRYETSAKLLTLLRGPEADAEADGVTLTSGLDYPDALIGGTYGDPVVLTRPEELPSSVSEALRTVGEDVGDLLVIGGTDSVSDDTALSALASAAGQDVAPAAPEAEEAPKTEESPKTEEAPKTEESPGTKASLVPSKAPAAPPAAGEDEVVEVPAEAAPAPRNLKAPSSPSSSKSSASSSSKSSSSSSSKSSASSSPKSSTSSSSSARTPVPTASSTRSAAGSTSERSTSASPESGPTKAPSATGSAEPAEEPESSSTSSSSAKSPSSKSPSSSKSSSESSSDSDADDAEPTEAAPPAPAGRGGGGGGGGWERAWASKDAEVIRAWFEDNVGPTVPIKGTVGGGRISSQADADRLVGKTVTGRLSVDCTCTLRDFAIVDANLTVNGGEVTVKDAFFDGRGNTSMGVLIKVRGSAKVDLSRIEITGHQDGIHSYTRGYTHGEFIYIHDVAKNNPKRFHQDGIQTIGGATDFSKSYIDMRGGMVSATLIKPDALPIPYAKVNSSVLMGGGWTIHVHDGPKGTPRNVDVSGNLVAKGYRKALMSTWKLSNPGAVTTTATVSGTGATVTLKDAARIR